MAHGVIGGVHPDSAAGPRGVLPVASAGLVAALRRHPGALRAGPGLRATAVDVRAAGCRRTGEYIKYTKSISLQSSTLAYTKVQGLSAISHGMNRRVLIGVVL